MTRNGRWGGDAIRVQVCRNQGFQQMNEGRLPNVEAKDTSAQSGWGWSGGGQKKYNRLQRARGAAVPAAPSPLSLSRGPTNSSHSCRRGSRARGETQGYGRPPSKVARHWPALRVEGTEAPAGIRPARAETPYYEPGVGDGMGWGEAGGTDAGPRSRCRLQLQTCCSWRLLPGQDPPPTPLASPPGLPRSKKVAGNTSKRSRSRRERTLMA